MNCFTATILFWWPWGLQNQFSGHTLLQNSLREKKSLRKIICLKEIFYLLLKWASFLRNVFMKSYIKEGPWLYIVSIAMYVPLFRTEVSKNKITSLPSWTLNYSKPLYNKLLKKVLSWRMPVLFLNSTFVSYFYLWTLCFLFLVITIWILSTVTSISLITKGFLLTFMTIPRNSFYIVWKARFLWDLIYQKLPAKGKVFFQCCVSLIIWESFTKIILRINMKCQNVAAMTRAK